MPVRLLPIDGLIHLLRIFILVRGTSEATPRWSLSLSLDLIFPLTLNASALTTLAAIADDTLSSLAPPSPPPRSNHAPACDSESSAHA